MRHIFRAAAAALLVVFPVYGFAQTINIPASPAVMQGQSSDFKHVATVDMTMFAQNQSIPFSMELVLLQNMKYGRQNGDGLIPVNSSFKFSRIDASFMGQKAPSMAKDIPELPGITTLHAKDGSLRGIQPDGLPAEAAQMLNSIPPELFHGQGDFSAPFGEVQLGVPIVRSMEMPMTGQNMNFHMTFTPIDVKEIQGEKAVQFFVNADSTFDMNMAAKDFGLPVDFRGKGNARVSGEMFVGLNTGELIRQDLVVALMMAMDFEQANMAADMKIKVSGFRMR